MTFTQGPSAGQQDFPLTSILINNKLSWIAADVELNFIDPAINNEYFDLDIVQLEYIKIE